MSDYWKEIEATPVPSGSQTAEEFLVPTNGRLALRAKAAAGWVWAFAGLSVINLVLAYVGGPFRFVIGLWSTEFLYAIGRAMGPVWFVLALVICSGAILGTAALGFLIVRYHRWSFIAATRTMWARIEPRSGRK